MAELVALMKAAAPAAQPAAPAPVAATSAPAPQQQYPQQFPPYAYPVMMPPYYGDYDQRDQRPRQYDRDDNYGRGRRGYNNRS